MESGRYSDKEPMMDEYHHHHKHDEYRGGAFGAGGLFATFIIILIIVFILLWIIRPNFVLNGHVDGNGDDANGHHHHSHSHVDFVKVFVWSLLITFVIFIILGIIWLLFRCTGVWSGGYGGYKKKMEC